MSTKSLETLNINTKTKTFTVNGEDFSTKCNVFHISGLKNDSSDWFKINMSAANNRYYSTEDSETTL